MYIENEKIPLIVFEDFFEKHRFEKMFEYFKNNIQWTQDEYIIKGKKVKSPRLTAMYGNRDYTYSGQTKKSIPFNKGLKYISKEIEKFLKLPENYFNGCLLNYYRDGNDSISYHTDNEKDMDKEGIIAVISIGAERKFYLKNQKTKEVVKYTLPNLSLAIMNPICQREWFHSIPKEKKIKEPRISLTFRKFN